MEYFRWTLFNGLTLFIMALTLGMALLRTRLRSRATWPLLYYLIILLFAVAFRYSLNLYWVAAGFAIALLVRFAPRPQAARVAEYSVLAYVFGRCFGLLMMW